MKVKKLVTTFSTTIVVAALATVWAIASPLATPCVAATPLELISVASGESSQFVSQINQLRRSRGLNELSVNDNLTTVAQAWAVTMATQDGIFHRSDLRSGITVNWERLGENVGMGPDVSELMAAFIASPGHYKNLVDPSFSHIGVGTVRTPDGLLYTAHEFAAIGGVVASPPITAPPVTAPRVTTPRLSTPRVTAAPLPTTTPPPPPTTTTTEPPVAVNRSTAEQHELQHGGADNQQQQKKEDKGRCRAHGDLRVVV